MVGTAAPCRQKTEEALSLKTPRVRAVRGAKWKLWWCAGGGAPRQLEPAKKGTYQKLAKFLPIEDENNVHTLDFLY